jgi:hypothetical protein
MASGEIVEIINVINLYPVAVDAQRWELFDLIFTADAQTSFGGPAGWTDLASLKRDFAAIHEPFEATLHFTSNHQVVVDGDTASCISYVRGQFIRDVGEGGNMFESTGWYDDHLVRTPAGWRIRHRECRSVWAGGNPRVLNTQPGMTGEQQMDSLAREARADRVRHLQALAAG